MASVLSNFHTSNALEDEARDGFALPPPLMFGNGLSLVDGSSWVLTDMVRANKATTDTGNEFGVNVQLNITGNTGSTSYEKAAAIFYAKTADPSSGTDLRDAVGIDTRGIIAGTTTGRAWGLYSEAQIAAAADGNAVNEIGVRNEGSDQTTLDATATGKNKIALSLFSSGSVPATLGLGYGGVFHKLIYAAQANIQTGATDSFIELGDGTNVLWRVDRYGQATVGRWLSQSASFTPTATGTGGGVGATYTLGTNSCDASGSMVITTAGAPASSGTFTVTFSTAIGAYGSSNVSVVVSLRSGSASWNSRALVNVFAASTTSFQVFWDNNGAALTAGQTYRIDYIVVGR
jgi:hypothetical protein